MALILTIDGMVEEDSLDRKYIFRNTRTGTEVADEWWSREPEPRLMKRDVFFLASQPSPLNGMRIAPS